MKIHPEITLIEPANAEEEKLLNRMTCEESSPYIKTMESPFRWYDVFPIHYIFFACCIFLTCTSFLKFSLDDVFTVFSACNIVIMCLSIRKMMQLYSLVFKLYFTSALKISYTESVTNPRLLPFYRFWCRLFIGSMESLLVIYIAKHITYVRVLLWV